MLRERDHGSKQRIRAYELFRQQPRWRKMRHSIVAAAALTVTLATSAARCSAVKS
jgi:hypothetical protein